MVCYCCGRTNPDTRVDSGAMHFRCWDEHHSDPGGEWPSGHICSQECGIPHPSIDGVTCTQPAGHQYEHVSFDDPLAGQW